MTNIKTSYLRHVFDQDLYCRVADKTIIAAEDLRNKTGFDTIAFSGMSGAAMAFLLSHWMNVPLLCVRKREDSSHHINISRQYLEGNSLNVMKYLIVDDFISSGATVQYVIDTIKSGNIFAECVGMLLYASYEDNSWTHPVTGKSYLTTSSRVED